MLSSSWSGWLGNKKYSPTFFLMGLSGPISFFGKKLFLHHSRSYNSSGDGKEWQPCFHRRLEKKMLQSRYLHLPCKKEFAFSLRSQLQLLIFLAAIKCYPNKWIRPISDIKKPGSSPGFFMRLILSYSVIPSANKITLFFKTSTTPPVMFTWPVASFDL